MAKNNIKRGQVWFYVPRVEPVGHIQKGPRPVIIVSNNHCNEHSPVVLAVPCTTQIKKNFPTHVMFIMDKQVNIAQADQAGPVNVDELVNIKYFLEEYIMERIDEAIKIAFGLTKIPSRDTELRESEEENKWTADKEEQFIEDCVLLSPECVCAKYNISEVTLNVYLRKFSDKHRERSL